MNYKYNTTRHLEDERSLLMLSVPPASYSDRTSLLVESRVLRRQVDGGGVGVVLHRSRQDYQGDVVLNTGNVSNYKQL